MNDTGFNSVGVLQRDAQTGARGEASPVQQYLDSLVAECLHLDRVVDVHAPSTCDLDVADDALAEHDAYAIVRMHHTGPKRSVYIPPELAHSFAGIAETYGRLMYTNALLLAGRMVHALLALDAWCARKADALQSAWTHVTSAVWGYVRRLSHVRERIYSTAHLPAGLPTGTCTLTFAGEGTRAAATHAPRVARTYAVVAEATLVGYHALRRVAYTIVRGHVDIK